MPALRLQLVSRRLNPMTGEEPAGEIRQYRLPPNEPTMRAVAEHIGWVVLAAASVDAVLSAVVGAVRRDSDLLSAWGASGMTLAGKLREIKLHEFADRYELLYRRRNQVIHSIYSEDGTPVIEGLATRQPLTSLKPERVGRASQIPPSVESLVSVEPLGVIELADKTYVIPGLIDLYYDLTELEHSARALFVKIATGQPTGL